MATDLRRGVFSQILLKRNDWKWPEIVMSVKVSDLLLKALKLLGIIFRFMYFLEN